MDKPDVIEAINRTKDDSKDLFTRLIQAMAKTDGGDATDLDTLFTTVHETPRSVDFVETKIKGSRFKSWLRLFAVRSSSGVYFITGGAIKLERTLQDHPATQRELDKVRAAARHFRKEDPDKFFELYEFHLHP
ncbi:hypothetical protein [Neolewinella antarctica]|uniref:Uncharacterized protein n=1 Tax=Neolewinella antarctica TaxID=442734 RepID=A0ABX0XDY6_9BACT|nr:hypothetical protein [Neolewinella antarctica]NJC27018.1 hypothetical protein [Neolewinella antarctica]